MTTYKVTYFDITTIGEPIRMILKYGNVDFEDVRIGMKDFPKIKKNLPFGQIPILDVGGELMYQSRAICRFLAIQAGLNGNDEMENYEIDNVVDTMYDFRLKITDWYFAENEQTKIVKKKIYDDNEIEKCYLTKLDEIAKENNGFLANKKISWADIWFIGTFDNLSLLVGKNLIANYPNLKKVHENLMSVPKIAKWIEERPKSSLMTE